MATVLITPGLEAVLVSITRLSIHGDEYVDVVIVLPQDPASRLLARLGAEAVDEGLAPGDTVIVEGFLKTVTGLRKK